MARLIIPLLCLALLIPAAPAASGGPVAEAGPGKTVYADDPVWLNGTASSDRPIALYEWDFEGDGRYDWRSTDSGNASHAYKTAGVYNPVFRVTDDSGLTGTDSTAVVVRTRNQAPFAEAGPDRTGEADLPVAFNGSGTDPDGRISEYDWDFENDGVWDYSGPEGFVSHVYHAPGEYLALLKVADNGTPPLNDTDICRLTVYVRNQPPSANAGPALTAVAGEPVVLAGRGFDPDGDIAIYEWDFNGDGRWDWNSTATGAAGWTYYEPGSWSAILRVTDNGPIPRSDTAATTVTVVPKNSPPLIFGPANVSGTAGRSVRLAVYASDGDPNDRVQKIGWDFDGNGIIEYYSADGRSNHTYGTAGAFRVKATAFDTRNATSSWNITVSISEPPAGPDPLVQLLPGLLVALAAAGIGAALTAPFMVWYIKRHWERFYKPTKLERTKMRSELEEEGSAGGFRGLPPGDGGDGRYRDLGT